MKILIILCLLALLGFSKDIKMGFLIYSTTKVESSIIKSIKVFQKQINTLSKGKYNFHLTTYTNRNAILKDYEDNKLNIVLIDTKLFLDNYSRFLKITSKFWKLKYGNRNFEQYYIIANSTSSLSIADISSYKLLTYSDHAVSNIWFRKRIYETYKTSFSNVIKNIEYTSNESQIVYKVFFNKKHLGIVNANVFNTTAEVNPQIKKKVYVIEKSKPIFNSVYILQRIGFDKKTTEDFTTLRITFQEYLKKYNLSELENTKNAQEIEDKDIQEILHFYKTFKELEKRFEKQNN